jgi:hypothetical protein
MGGFAQRGDLITRRRTKRRKNVARPDGTQQSVEKFAGDAYSLARRAVSGLDQIRRLINIETKSFLLYTTSNPSTTTSVEYASGILQGTDQGQRVGNSIKLHDITITGSLYFNSSSNQTFVRLLLIRDMENSGSLPTAAQIFETTGNPYSPLNFTNSKRFSVLVDNFMTVDPTSNRSLIFRENVSLERHVSYRTSVATIGGAAEGTLYWVSLSNEATNTPSLTTYLQFTYTDD